VGVRAAGIWPPCTAARSGLTAFFEADLGFGFGALDVAAGGEPLVPKHPQRFDFRALPGALAVLEHLDVARPRHAVLIHGALFFGGGAPEHQQLADMLDRRCIQRFAYGVEQGFTPGPVIGKHPDLDEPVGIERSVDFLGDVGCQTVVSHHHHRIEVVGGGAVDLALGRRQLDEWHVGIIGAMKPQSKSTKAIGKKVNKAWLHDHINDPYVKLAAREGYRARAAYKLKEIDETLHLIKPGHLVVDLGSTPGAWSQYARRRLSPAGAAAGDLNGSIIALDMLPMEPIEGVTFIQGDFREATVLAELEAAMAGRRADVVVSDMAPNLSGIASADAARVAYLVELAIEFARNHMKPEGTLVAKVFHGGSYSEVVQRFKAAFHSAKPLKPKASRDRSSETFLVGTGLR